VDASRSSPLKVLSAPLDKTYGTGTYQLPTGAVTQGSTAFPTVTPNWVTNTANTTWGVSSYSANWQVFGDVASNLNTRVSDGMSNTFIFGEKYASMTGGAFGACANLWAYGVDPRSIPNDFTPALTNGQYPTEAQWANTVPSGSLYNSPYWPRNGYVNKSSASSVAQSAGGTFPYNAPWNCRCMRHPEWAPVTSSVHPQKNQSFSAAGIQVCLADGSVRFYSAAASDQQWVTIESPFSNDVVYPDQ
jgi:hypothetical protein